MDHEGRALADIKKLRTGARGITKVKTGCLTCKIRHKKCDEVKPACSQCVNTGRKCDFLSLFLHNRIVKQPQSDDVRAGQSDSQPLRLGLWQRPANAIHLRDFEVLHFEYFRSVCAKEFSLYFEVPFWETVALQAACNELCIRHASLAIGALSRSKYVPTGSEDGLYNTRSVMEYSTKQYNLAIQALNSRLNSSYQSQVLAILGSIFFIAIEVLQGHDNRVPMHLCSASAILRDMPVKVAHSMPEMGYLVGALSQLSIQASSLPQRTTEY